jgi:hypothetical protein
MRQAVSLLVRDPLHAQDSVQLFMPFASSYAELVEPCFQVLETLSLASAPLSAMVAQQRTLALTSLPLPPDVALQQQTAANQWMNSLANVVSRNKQVLEGLSGGGRDLQGAVAGAVMMSAPMATSR